MAECWPPHAEPSCLGVSADMFESAVWIGAFAHLTHLGALTEQGDLAFPFDFPLPLVRGKVGWESPVKGLEAARGRGWSKLIMSARTAVISCKLSLSVQPLSAMRSCMMINDGPLPAPPMQSHVGGQGHCPAGWKSSCLDKSM